MAVLVISFLWLISSTTDSHNCSGQAPDGDYNIRRKWGEENLGIYLASAENWIKRNAKIEKDIGKVSGVAPIWSPNKHGSSFGESWTDLSLQVIGSQGKGILIVEEHNFNWRLQSRRQPEWHEKYWSFQRLTDSQDSPKIETTSQR